MKELYQETIELFVKKGITFNQSITANNVGLWWALWIINNVIGQFVIRTSMKAVTIDDFITSTIASIIGNVLGIFLALITVKVIRDYSNLERHLNEIIIDEQEEMKTEL